MPRADRMSSVHGGRVDLPESTRQLCAATDAVLLGAIAGPAETGVVEDEPCLLSLLRQLQVYANLRPVKPHPAMAAASPLRPEMLEGVDILFVRELTGGIYFGAKTRTAHDASDVCVYTVPEIERVVRMACELARGRRGKVTMVDKANVLETSRLWRDTSARLVGEEFPDIEYDHTLVDAMAMHLLDRPASFDVIVTENMFGDILTDEASMLAGSMSPPELSADVGSFVRRRRLPNLAWTRCPIVAGSAFARVELSWS